jgi:Tfp pilus assembly protein PilX
MKNSVNRQATRGFTLVVTLSLMILLTVIAVGLLSLSSISLRSSSQGDGIARARSNAKMALLMALGDLPREMGAKKSTAAAANRIAVAAST